ncbi:hypothetical protein AALO_G00190000 [Alosa alosa]|uniref:Insulin-like growth factor binding protein 7 n=1 Tax=Alosa alosa TaxID=278164 RepID=A0AAV6G510_9TELE|nr:insulin-like growth factor-binding protein 7 [Alosa alosa]KAG5270209.1 hypothetical protein AALO_G00190000 [Alosa alosa]
MLTFSVLVLVLSVLTASSTRVTRSCGECVPEKCAPLPADGCTAGTVMDSCGCCSVCAGGPGDACGGRGSSAKRCAPGLECVKSDTDKKSKLGTCVCKSNYPVCGTDGINYVTGCDLRAASQKAVKDGKPEIAVQNKGMCAQAPVIVTAPGEVWNVTGSQVYLSCEAIGVPTPVVTWKKIVPGKGRTELLPGDRDNLAIQTRGGPEKHEVTGWVLISPLTKQEAGVYECHANNLRGEAFSTGTIHVVDSEDDIPAATKVTKDDEL